MKFDESVVRHVEALARIELTPEERTRLAAQLEKIVGYVEQIQGVDAGGVAPTSAVVHEGTSALRPDEPRPGLERDAVLGQAPDTEDGFFRVPRVIERP